MLLPIENTTAELLARYIGQRLIENLRYYEQAESLDFLRELDRPELFGDDPLDS